MNSANKQRILNDTWKFDWNVVIKECPEYKQYCHDAVKQYGQGEGPNPDTDENLTVQIDDGNGVLTPFGRQHITDENELDIIRQISTQDEDDEEEVGGDTEDLRDGHDLLLDGLRETHEWWEDEEARLSSSSEKKEKPPEYDLDEEFNSTYYGGVGDPGVPMLPVPKRFLATGSILWYGNYQKYQVSHTQYGDNPDTVNLHKDVIYIRPDKVQFVTGVYLFDRVKNFTSDKKKHLQFVTFSEKTGGLYWTTHEVVKSSGRSSVKTRYRRLIRRVGLRQEGVLQTLTKMPDRIRKKFLQEVIERASRMVKGLIVPEYSDQQNEYANQAWVLTAVLWQLKAKKPLKWVENRVLLMNLSVLLEEHWTRQFGELNAPLGPIATAMEERIPKLKGVSRKNILRRVHRAVRKHNSPKPILRAILGRCYNDLFAKILLTYSMGDRITSDPLNLGNAIVGWVTNEGLSKNIIHLLAQMFKAGKVAFDHFRTMLNGLGYLAHPRRDLSLHTFERWVQYNRQLFETLTEMLQEIGEGKVDSSVLESHFGSIDWGHFRDTMDMADQLGLRIRLNKYDGRDFRLLHDKLSGMVTRDSSVRRNIPIFFPFAHPTKEYDGFTFVHLDTSEKLVEEGTSMKHCVAGYANGCYNGHSIMFSMRNGRSWITLELAGHTKDYQIAQQYTIGDFQVRSSKFQKIINAWHKDLKEMHALDEVPYQTHAKFAATLVSENRTLKQWTSANELTEELADGRQVKLMIESTLARITEVQRDIIDMNIDVEEIDDYVTQVEQAIEGNLQQV